MKKMKKTIKYLCIVMISSLVLGVGLVVCGFCHTQPSYTPPAPPETLSAPSDLECLIGTWPSGETDYTLTWTGDKNASGYKIVIEKMGKTPIEKEVGAFVNEYDMTEHLVSGSQYRISVTAIGDGDKYLSSEKTKTYYKAETPTKGLRYTKIKGKDGYEVSKGTSGYPTKQILPDLYNGLYVIKIADYGFGLPEGSLYVPISTPVSVRFPKKLVSIGMFSFRALVELNSIEIPETVTEIGERAFMWCYKLKTNLPPNLTRIESGLFMSCKELKDVLLPKNLTYIGESAFNGCESIKEIKIPETLEYIGVKAFFECKSITEIIIPESVKYIGDYAFSHCENLERVEIPESVDYYGARMLSGTKWYANQPDGFICFEDKVYSYKGEPKDGIIDCFPEGITQVISEAFMNNESLVSVTIPEGWETLKGKSIFRGCTSLQTVSLPSTFKRIEFGMFDNCTSLKEITIPENVEYIGEYAFRRCEQLKRIELPSKIKTVSGSVFSRCYNLEEVILPDGVEVIEEGAFQNCRSLKELNLPKNIKKIGDLVINNTQIESIVLPKSIEELSAYAFDTKNTLKTIYYCGNLQDWSKIQFYNGTELETTATIYFYSETKPTEEGNYWHYDTDGTPVVWEI